MVQLRDLLRRRLDKLDRGEAHKLKCDECEYTTPNKVNLIRHQKGVHLRIKDQRCKECDYTTSNPGNLSQHVKAVHLKIMNFKCDACDFKTAYQRNLSQHKKICAWPD